MKWRLLIVAVLFAPSAALADDTELVKTELAKLQGKWLMVSGVQNGKSASEEELKKLIVIMRVQGEKYTILVDNKVTLEVAFKIDPSKKPKWVTDDTDGRYGIYEIDGDTLKAAFAIEEKNRPTEFSSKVGSKQNLYVFKRVK
jgi:uncharacterized protein (TIGR03067 family)